MRFLAVGAHPDDIDDSLGGTVGRLAKPGYEMSYLICTDGSKGTPNMGEVAARRRDERRAAAEAVGAGPVYILTASCPRLLPRVEHHPGYSHRPARRGAGLRSHQLLHWRHDHQPFRPSRDGSGNT